MIDGDYYYDVNYFYFDALAYEDELRDFELKCEYYEETK